MSKVIFDISLSLDGYITAANQTPDEPMGDGGQRLHEWAFGDDERDRAILTEGMASIGAVIAGRRTYDDSVPWWGPDGPPVPGGSRWSSCRTACPTRRRPTVSTASSPTASRPPSSRRARRPATRT